MRILDEVADCLGEQLAVAEQRDRRAPAGRYFSAAPRSSASGSYISASSAASSPTSNQANWLRPVSASDRLISSTAVRIRISESAWRMTLPSNSSCSAGSLVFGRRMSGRAQPADRRAQVVREDVGQQPKLLHQPADPVEHGVDLPAEAVERVAGAGQRARAG